MRRWQQLAWCALCALPATVANGELNGSNVTVHIVFSNHLDVGYNGITPEFGLDNNVINKYFDWYFPMAVRLSEYFESRGPERHIYTAHSYIVSLYLECPKGMGLHCPRTEEVAQFERAVTRGDITWTALPFNAQVEMMDAMLLESAVSLTGFLDADCGVPAKTVISQRDVPGLTRNALSTLNYKGIRALSVGVNSGSAPPGVPKNAPFVWRDEPSGAQVIAFWHPYGYGGHTVDAYGHRLQLTPPEDCVYTPAHEDGRQDVLCFSWRSDNAGPFEDPDDVLKVLRGAQERFPGARVEASTFEAFVDALEAFEGQLEVVTGEIGDTWIYGVASDPVKVQQYRAIMRMRSQCLWSWSCTPQDPAFRNFTRLLLKVPEHTWGISTMNAPASYDIWSNEDFRRARVNESLFAIAEASWERQALYLSWSIEALRSSPYKAHVALAARLSSSLAALAAPHAIVQELDVGARLLLAPFDPPPHLQSGAAAEELRGGRQGQLQVPTSPSASSRAVLAVADDRGIDTPPRTGGRCEGSCRHELRGQQPRISHGLEEVLDSKLWHISVDVSSGTILSFRRKWLAPDGSAVLGTDWAAEGTFGSLVYQTHSEGYFKTWDSVYNPLGEAGYNGHWQYPFGKPGSAAGGAKDSSASPLFVGHHKGPGPASGEEVLVLKYEFRGWPLEGAGAPRFVHLILRSWPDSLGIMLDVVYEHKLPTRLPEALWLSFKPSAHSTDLRAILLSKVDTFISPLEVMTNGSFNLHALTDGGVLLPSKENDWEVLQAIPMDTALAAIGPPEVLPDISGPARPEDGFNFCLFNNAWGTNYVMWTPYGQQSGALKSRFVLTVRNASVPLPSWKPLGSDPHLAGIPAELLT